MFFLVSGSAASGKTTLSRLLKQTIPDLRVHDADEMVAEDAETRCAQLELWVQRALAEQQRGYDFLLASNSPLGELLACPSAPLLDGIAACLLDCADVVRIGRMRARGIDPKWPPNQAIVNWAAWHRMHASDPRWEPHVISSNGPPTHRYDRWQSWTADDPRWRVFVLDTTALSDQQALSQLHAWIDEVRAAPCLLSSSSHWWDPALSS